MSVNPVSAPQRPSTSNPAPEPGRSAAQSSRDAHALAEEFAAAARKGALPLGKPMPKAMPAGKGDTLVIIGKDGQPLPVGVDGQPLPPRAGTGKGLGARDDRPGEVRKDDSMPTLQLSATPGGGFVAPMQAPPPVAAHVDPGAFADMLTRIWTREQGRTAKEVRVQFGDAAWPATGARLLRLEDGSLQVMVSVGYRGAELSGGLDALRERLTARGLHIADLGVEDDVG